MGWRVSKKAWEFPELLQVYFFHEVNVIIFKSILNFIWLKKALRILTGYLTSSSISPLQRNLVEIDDPVATNIDVEFIVFSEPGFNINFDDVPVNKIEHVDKQFDEIVQNLIDNGPELFELDLIKVISKLNSFEY